MGGGQTPAGQARAFTLYALQRKSVDPHLAGMCFPQPGLLVQSLKSYDQGTQHPGLSSPTETPHQHWLQMESPSRVGLACPLPVKVLRMHILLNTVAFVFVFVLLKERGFS